MAVPCSPLLLGEVSHCHFMCRPKNRVIECEINSRLFGAKRIFSDASPALNPARRRRRIIQPISHGCRNDPRMCFSVVHPICHTRRPRLGFSSQTKNLRLGVRASKGAPRDHASTRGRGAKSGVSWPSVADRTAHGCLGWTVNEIPSTPDGNWNRVS